MIYELHLTKNELGEYQAESIDDLQDKFIEHCIEEGEFTPAVQIDIIDDEGEVEEYEDLEDFNSEALERFEKSMEIIEQEKAEAEDLVSELRGML